MESLYKIFTQDFQNTVYYQPSILVLDDLHIICGKSEAATEVPTQESLYFSRYLLTIFTGYVRLEKNLRAKRDFKVKAIYKHYL